MKICHGKIPKGTLALPVLCLDPMARWVGNATISPESTYCCWQPAWTWNEVRPWHSWDGSVPSRRWPGVPLCSHSLAAASPGSRNAETAKDQDTHKLYDKPSLLPTFIADPLGGIVREQTISYLTQPCDLLRAHAFLHREHPKTQTDEPINVNFTER